MFKRIMASRSYTGWVGNCGVWVNRMVGGCIKVINFSNYHNLFLEFSSYTQIFLSTIARFSQTARQIPPIYCWLKFRVHHWPGDHLHKGLNKAAIAGNHPYRIKSFVSIGRTCYRVVCNNCVNYQRAVGWSGELPLTLQDF
jgi:hypothetical protein